MAAAAPITLMPPTEVKGRFVVIAKVTAKEGREEELLRFLKAVAKESAEEEPGCLTYRPTRGTGDQTNTFTIIEEYKSREDLKLHRTGKAYLAFRAAGVVEATKIEFLKEIEV